MHVNNYCIYVQSPVPANSWSGILDASSFGPSCYQFDAMVQGTFLGDEDCLFLNVFVPNINNPSPLPVMVWIHGGGFLR
jgi:carboxylesterase type B